jgi:hypothetical protein
VPTPPPPEHSRWKPGQSGNPKGYSRGRRAVDHVLELIEEKDADRAVAEVWFKAILERDFRYFKEYLDRRDGKVADRHEHDFANFTDEELRAILSGSPDRSGEAGPDAPDPES